ncbi:MAG: MliC family protein [Hyphomicrobiales bacterium]|nr:MliC family protein [Hyphomicrobiales bacterium]
MRMIPVLVGAFALGTTAALADPLSIDLPGAASAERSTVGYACDGGRKVSAEYVNAGDNSFAIVNLGEKSVLMVTVLSGSGARYAGQQYIWWTKGNSADFYDLTKGENAGPEFSCNAQ